MTRINPPGTFLFSHSSHIFHAEAYAHDNGNIYCACSETSDEEGIPATPPHAQGMSHGPTDAASLPEQEVKARRTIQDTLKD